MVWTNGYLQLFHGSHSEAFSTFAPLVRYQTISGFKVALRFCSPQTDFGRGFYATTSLHQARQWANEKVRRLRNSVRPVQTDAVVLLFEIDRDWLASLDSLAFVQPSLDYYDLTTSCRHGLTPHQRIGPKSHYDVVFGPVRLWPQQLVIQDCDQVSFHDAISVQQLTDPLVYEIANSTDGLL